MAAPSTSEILRQSTVSVQLTQARIYKANADAHATCLFFLGTPLIGTICIGGIIFAQESATVATCAGIVTLAVGLVLTYQFCNRLHQRANAINRIKQLSESGTDWNK